MKISIAIPAYEYKGKGAELLEFSFEKMKTQTFKDFNVVVSDHSLDKSIEDMCKKWENELTIKYVKNTEKRGNPAANLNNAIKESEGEWIKILCQDDYLMYDNSLEIIADAIGEENWIATGYIHTRDRKNYQVYHAPFLNPQLYITNTVGTPSCVAIKNVPQMVYADENLKYAYDCEFYFRFMTQYGKPKIITDVTIANFLWDGALTAIITPEFIEQENAYILNKHGIPKNENQPV